MSHRLPPAAQKEFERAVSLFREGRLATADGICTDLLVRYPQDAEVAHFGGILANRMGRYDIAVQRLKRCVQAEPHRARAQAALGLAHEQLGQLEEAQRAFASAVKAEPSFAEAHNGLGVAMLRAGRAAEAAASFDRALALDPRSAETRLNFANALRRLGREALAAQHYREAAALAAGRDDLLRIATLGILDSGDAQGAIPLLRDLLSRTPGDAIARSQLALALDATGSPAEALEEVRQAVVSGPDVADVHNAHGTVLLHEARWEEARAALEKALRLHPTLADARLNLALALHELGRDAEALECMRAVEGQLDPRGLARLATLYNNFGRPDRTIELAERALSASPSLADAHTTLSLALISTGELRRGWKEYAFRPTRGRVLLEDVAVGRYPPRLPASLAGRDVVIMAEQCLGDVLLFLRYAVPLVAAGARLHLGNCDPRLVPLVKRALPVDVWEKGRTVPSDALLVWAGDLAAFVQPLGARDAEPPLAIGALPEWREKVRARLAGDSRPAVGLAWRAGTPPRTGPIGHISLSKEISARALGTALAGLPLRWVVVQRRPTEEELRELEAGLGEKPLDLSPVNENLEEVLAAMAELDDYAGVSNTNIHLRAGLGLGGRILVPFPADWRWQSAGDSPFFEKFTTYREAPAGWDEALARLRADLERLAP